MITGENIKEATGDWEFLVIFRFSPNTVSAILLSPERDRTVGWAGEEGDSPCEISDLAQSFYIHKKTEEVVTCAAKASVSYHC